MSDDATKQDKPARQSQPRLVALPDFGPRYRVIGAIGKGGMGEVFRAYDTELKGEVALKIIRDDADHEAALARFRREIALARKVTSPNVLRVYDLAEYEGLRFLSMEYVDGDDLAAVLRRDERIPLERAVQIFRQVCLGLAAAHAEGVVHRDLKPQNVLVDSEGRVRVGDFGLARSIGDSGLTASGAVLGSPAYMSPEQVKGDPTDERSDIYSLGIMLYQLVTGQTPFQAPTPHAVMEMRLHKKPPPLRDVRPDAPAHLEAICAKCLALHPSARYSSVDELLAVLDAGSASKSSAPSERRPKWLVPIVAGGAIAALAAIAFVAWPRRHEPTTPAASPPVPAAAATPPEMTIDPHALTTVLVLGFENRSPEAIFVPTLERIMVSSLRRSDKIDPVSGSEMRALAETLGPDTPLDDKLGDLLAARDHVHVLSVHGSIAQKGAGFTIAISVREAITGRNVYSNSLDAKNLDAVVTTTARLASGLRNALGEQLADNELERTGLSPSLDADHELAIALDMKAADNVPGAITHLEEAIVKDPKFALAHLTLGLLYYNTMRPREQKAQFDIGLKLVDQMNERDRLKFLGDYYVTAGEDHERAIALYEQLLAKWPTDSGAETNISIAYQGRGDVKKALEWGERAAKDHPRNPVIRANLPQFEILAGELERAREDARRVLAEFPRPSATVYQYLGIASLLLGKESDAADAYRKMEELDASVGACARADAAIGQGRLAEAKEVLEKGIDKDKSEKLAEAAELKQAMLAELLLRRGDKAGARAVASLVNKEPDRVFTAALVLADAGDDKHAAASAAHLASEVAPGFRAEGKLIEGEILRTQGKPQPAMIAFSDAIRLADTPLAHFLLARAAIDAQKYADAYAELQTCIARRGEAAINHDDVPTYRYVPLFTYYMAKAQDGLGSPDARTSYASFLAMTHEPDADDPLVLDAKKHEQTVPQR